MATKLQIETPNGTVELTRAALIGRAHMARIRLDCPAVSEAHALITLRGDGWRVQALRGSIYRDVQGSLREEDEVRSLAAGTTVYLTPDRAQFIRVVVAGAPSGVWVATRGDDRRVLTDDDDLSSLGEDHQLSWNEGVLQHGSEPATSPISAAGWQITVEAPGTQNTAARRTMRLHQCGDTQWVVLVVGAKSTTLENIVGRILFCLGSLALAGTNVMIRRDVLAGQVVKSGASEKNVSNHVTPLRTALSEAGWPDLLRMGKATLGLSLGPQDQIEAHGFTAPTRSES